MMTDLMFYELLAKSGGMDDHYYITIGEFVEQMFNTKNPAHTISKAIKLVDNQLKTEGDTYDFHEYMENIDVGIWIAQNRRIRNRARFTDERIMPNPDPIAGLAIIGPDGQPIVEYIPYGFEIKHFEYNETDDAEIMGMEITSKSESYDEGAVYATTSRTLTDLTTEGHIEYDVMVPLSSVYQCLVRLLQHPEVNKYSILYAVTTNGALISIDSFTVTVNADMNDYPSVQINCVGV